MNVSFSNVICSLYSYLKSKQIFGNPAQFTSVFVVINCRILFKKNNHNLPPEREILLITDLIGNEISFSLYSATNELRFQLKFITQFLFAFKCMMFLIDHSLNTYL